MAAHITAASPGGPRYDSLLTPDQRCHAENAIWLCNSCGALVDADPDRFTVDLLRQWKAWAEGAALELLTNFQAKQWPAEIKTECGRLLNACDQATGSHEKGVALEKLVKVLFSSSDGLAVEQTRAKTGDEEIDLLCINNVDRPFWVNLKSPVLFVECKNWRKRVGTREMRDFEIKLQNHSVLTRVGFLVSLSGFTSQVYSELKRASRSDYLIVPVGRSDIIEYLGSQDDLLRWLEKLMIRLC